MRFWKTDGRKSAFYRPQLGSVTLSVCVALFLLFTSNRTFWSKVHTYLAQEPTSIFTLYIAMIALFTAALTVISTKYVIKPFFIFFVMASAAASWFMDQFGVVIDSDMMRNAYQTTPAEAQHLITWGFVGHLALFAFLPMGLILWVRVVHRPILGKIAHNCAVIAGCMLVFTGAAVSYSATYTAAVREHRDIARALNPVTPLVSVVKLFTQVQAEAKIVAQPLGHDAKVVPPVNGSRKPRVTVIVAGETARAQNFSLGGYQRETNPLLAKQDIIYFPETYSCGTATATSLPCMFSKFKRVDYTHEKGLETETLVDVIENSGIKVEWWDNSTGSKGIADRIPFVNLSASNDTRYCKLGECQDGVFLDKLEAWLRNVKQDSVLVLHQMGSHGPAYYLRYPDAFRRFTPDCRTAELGNCKPDEIVNTYDNTILYTDFILSSIIEGLKASSERVQGSMIYMSDHGESLGEQGLYLHGAPYMLAPDVQTKIPFVLWMDRQFEESMGVDRVCLSSNRNSPQSHDNLFNSVLSMMNISSSIYDRSLDIFAECKRFNPS
ncbi:phosphoethanolamine--lipid A transferase [Agrobacterium rubi]|nr:phosphoethanolamine--lipid A transferase [Agrobacterium rubi]NTF29529.1 phosphoethanolamine--lipid A transferase [Agrobacterium rubi]